MMKSVVFHGKEDIRVEERKVPECGKGQVKIKPAFCGICGSDLHEFLGGASIIPTTPHPITGECVPVTLGHEFSGTVEEIGSDVQGFKVGDNVAIEPIIWDGDCEACTKGLQNCCQKGGFVGLSGWGGGLSEHVVLPPTSLYKLPDTVSLEVGALVEPMAVAWHAVKMSGLEAGDKVLVLGGGPIGLAVIQVLKMRGAASIIVSEVAKKRTEFALEFGATHTLNPIEEDVVARCREISASMGVDTVFDCAGVQSALEQGLKALRPQGLFVGVAVWEKPAPIFLTKLSFSELRYQGIVTYTRGDFQEVIDAISTGKLKPAGMITKKITMDEIHDGFQALIHDKAGQVKVMVDCRA